MGSNVLHTLRQVNNLANRRVVRHHLIPPALIMDRANW